MVAAMVWQMGACPCGCVDHNLWLETYQWLTGRSVSIHAGSATATVDAHDCDHRPRDSYMRARTVGENGESHLVPSPHHLFLCLNFSMAKMPMWPVCRSGFIKAAWFSDAQEMRAHLQVLLI